ncbi:MAG: DUF1080 domain-containing protein [Opitutaceae bacterium]|nr:DUF1080 domain-containing protein [Opitutaceae bacterium]
MIIRTALLITVFLSGSATTRSLAAGAEPAKSRELAAVVQSNADVAERARALQQLALVATPDAIPVLVPLLDHAQLGQYARDVLEVMPDAAAADALRAALARLQGNALIGVVNSLGQRRDAASAAALARLAADASSPAAAAALLALGRIGTPEAVRTLESALAGASAALRAAAAEGCLLAAERAEVENRPAAARSLYDLVRRADVPASWRETATRAAILAGGADGLALLLAQLRGPDPELRAMALRTARDLREPRTNAALIAELDALPPARRALVLGVLVDRGGEGVTAAVEARAQSGPDAVRVPALQALGRVGGPTSVPLLLAAARDPAGGAIADAAVASLARIDVPDTDARILAALPSAAPELRVRLIGVLGERKAAGATDEMIRLAAGSDAAVAAAALRTLGLIATPDRLPQLIQLALAMTDEARKTLADRAIVTTAMRVLEPARRAAAVLDAFVSAREPATKAALLRPLGAIMRTLGGSHDVFFAVQAALKDPAPLVRDAAVRCLADWPDAAPATTLLALAQQADLPAAAREVALGGAIRLATEVAAGRERSPLDARAVLVEAARLVRSDAEKMMLVSALGNLRHPDALRLLRPYLDDPAVRSEAALAVVQVAPALGNTVKGGGEAKELLTRIAASEKDEDVRRRAARLARGEAPPAAKKKAGAGAPAVPALAAGQLFNGRDLFGWDGDPGVWRVRDGVIVGGSMLGNPRNEFLATKRTYRNFVLRLEYRLVGTEGFVNGGVQVRSVRIAQPPNEMSGYQADIGAGHSGCLYDESRRKKFLARGTDEQIKRLEKVGDWNRYEIRCEGPRVEITLNGEKTVTYTESDPTVVPEGLIALQIHGNCKAEIAFRDLKLEELP